MENSAYTTTVGYVKNNYLTYNASNTEDIAYAISIKAETTNVLNSIMVYDHCDTVYMSYAVFNGYKIFYSRYIHNSHDIWFSSNCINCQECLFCSNVENTSYCIRNQQLDKDTYLLEKQKILQQKDQYMNWFAAIDREGQNYGSKDCI
jgi:hypothetical protein